MSILFNIFWFLVTFSILVVLHEGGHFLAARAFGVHVREFMIGLPGPSLRFRGKKTAYGVTAIPLGGYVRISGMEPGPEDERLAAVLAYVTRNRTADPDQLAHDLGLTLEDADILLATLLDWDSVTLVEGTEATYESVHSVELAGDAEALLNLARSTTYRGLSSWKRIVVLLAGVSVNLVSAVLVFVLVLTIVGLPTQTLTVGHLVPTGAAAAAGLHVGETIKTMDGKAYEKWDALVSDIGAHKPGDTVHLTVEQGGKTRSLDVTLRSDKGHARLGVQGASANIPLSIPKAFAMSFGLVGQVFQAIGGFFNPATFSSSVQNSTGVIGIAVMAGQTAERGPIDFAFFIALLSLSLGAMNILPIPPLDGGKVVLEIVEAVVRRPLPRRLAIGISLAGMALLLSLISYLMYIDVIRFVVKGG
jgi:regulator of sigma E protease